MSSISKLADAKKQRYMSLWNYYFLLGVLVCRLALVSFLDVEKE